MKGALLFSVVVALAAAAAASNSDLSFLVEEKCARGGQENAECYSRVLTTIVQGITKGVSDLDFASMDPLATGPLNLTVNAGSDQFKMNFLQPHFTGLSTASVSKLRVGNPVEVALHIPTVVMSSSYVNSGKLIVIKASGGGAMTNTFEDVSLVMRIAHSRDAAGQLQVDGLEVRFLPKKSKMRVDRLNTGNALARDLYNIFLSASGGEILGLMSDQLNSNFGATLKDTAQFIVKNLPESSVFEKESN